MPGSDNATQRDVAKVLLNRFDMDGTFDGWKTDMEQQHGGSFRDAHLSLCRIRLPNGRTFNPATYCELQRERTALLANKLPMMLDLMRQARTGNRDRPECTLKSYVLQEFEAKSRVAKMQALQDMGGAWISLQHDGVVGMAQAEMSLGDITAELSRRSSAALGYTQEVEAKSMGNTIPADNVEWDVTTETRHRSTEMKWPHHVCIAESKGGEHVSRG